MKYIRVLLSANANTLIGVALLSASSVASAGVHFSLAGSHSKSSAGYQTIESGAGSGSVDVDLGEYFRLGYSYRQELASTSGYATFKDPNTGKTITNADGTDKLAKFASINHVTTNSVDLTIVLYAGDIITPYIFGGLALKKYEIQTEQEGWDAEKTTLVLPTPNGGAGLAIRLNQKFSLKISHTLTQGVKQLPNEKAEPVTDGYTQFGISYAL